MSSIFDKDFAPLRISTQAVGPRDIIKDSKVNHEQIMKTKKIPLVISTYQDIVTERSNDKEVQSSITNSSNSLTHMQNIQENKPYHNKPNDNQLFFLDIGEQYLLEMIQGELRAKVYSSEEMWCDKQNQLDIKLSFHLIPMYIKVYNYLSRLIELNNFTHNNKSYMLNLIEPYSTIIHTGEIGLHYSIQKLKTLYPDYSIIIIDGKAQPNSLLQQILYQVISQINEIDPNLIETIEHGAPYSNFIKLLIDLIEYSNSTSRKKTLLIFIDSLGYLRDIYNNCLDYIKPWNGTIKIGYIRLSNNELDGLVNVICDSYPSNESEYFQEVIDNLIIKPCDKNDFVEIFNTIIISEVGKKEDGLANLLTGIIKSHYKSHTSSVDCYQNILQILVTRNQLSQSNIPAAINSTVGVS